MRAGLLKDFVKIETPVRTATRYGSQETTWSEYWSGRAWVRFSSGTQVVENGETFNRVTKKVTIRYKTDVQSKMRLVINEKKYRILSIDESRSDQSTTLTVELINE